MSDEYLCARFQASGIVAAGLGIAAVGVLGRFAFKAGQQVFQTVKRIDLIPPGAFSKYYRGGFERQMTRREAFLILGISPSSSKERIREAHKRVMLLNHPDRGGSPYIAAKINEAKDFLDQK
ncbi:unnamed protein product [Soboliphyme baturini]|uniref:DnaJ homolog subfamily C member 21 n=1 Tax=Soboliphyme baturini TaxID=241478 RepID=A0A183J845_9BILA|nr:unnamed protein product [Soboliphyme baturini]